MAEQDRGSDDPQLAAIARHALHDEELIAAFAAGDVDDAAERARAGALVDRCPPCRELHADLVSIRSAIQVSGSAAERATTLTAPRDFRLTAEDAARLRPGSPIGGVAARLGWRRRLALGIAAFGRPVGAAMATFGVLGLLIGSLTLGGIPFAAMSGAAGSGAAPGVDQLESGPQSTDTRTSYGPAATAKGAEPGDSREGGPVDAGRPGGSLLLIGGSVAFVALGLGLLLAARRGAAPSDVPPPRN